VTDPELLLKDIQRRQRQHQEIAAKDRLASENPHPVRELVARTGEALVQLGTQLRAWGGESGQPAGPQKWGDEAASPTSAPPKPRPCPEPPSLTWEKRDGAYWITIGAHEPSRR
jgi:hypothetical protein